MPSCAYVPGLCLRACMSSCCPSSGAALSPPKGLLLRVPSSRSPLFLLQGMTPPTHVQSVSKHAFVSASTRRKLTLAPPHPRTIPSPSSDLWLSDSINHAPPYVLISTSRPPSLTHLPSHPSLAPPHPNTVAHQPAMGPHRQLPTPSLPLVGRCCVCQGKGGRQRSKPPEGLRPPAEE